MCTAHGALSCEYPAQAFEFTEYHWLFLAYKTLGMPNCNTEDAFNHCYLRDYLGQYTVEYFNFWEEYCVTLAGRYNSSTERNAMDKEEKRTARRWMNWQERQEEREEEEREERLASGEPDPVSWRRTLEMTTGEEQIVWDQLADEREAREDANVEE